MVEWIRNIYSNSIKYGIDKINTIAVTGITSIFNICGSRFFQLENENVIKETQITNDFNRFFLISLPLKEKYQIIGNNNLKLINGIIYDPIIEIPRSDIFKKSTILRISDIQLNFSMDKRIFEKSVSELESSYLLDREKKNNECLLDSYREIGNLLEEYFKNFQLKIDKININIGDLTIVFNNIFYQTILEVENVEIYHSTEPLCRVKNICFDNKTIIIENIHLNSDIFNYIPKMYSNSEKTNINFIFNCSSIILDNIRISNLEFEINSNCFSIKKIKSIEVDSTFHFETSEKCFLSGCIENNLINLHDEFILRIDNLSKIYDFIDKIKKLQSILNSKIIYETKNNNNFIIEKINGKIIFRDKIFLIKIDSFNILEFNAIALNVYLEYCNVCALFNIEISDIIELTDISIDAVDFSGISKRIQFVKKDYLNIIFDSTNINHIVPLVKTIKEIIELFSEKNEEESIVYFQVKNSSILFDYSNSKIKLIIYQGNICYNELCIQNAKIDVKIDDFNILKLFADEISKKNTNINKIKLIITPSIFDKLNEFVGFFKKINEDTNEEIKETLNNSYIFENISDFEHTLNEKLDTVKNNYENLTEIIVQNYFDEKNVDLNISIEKFITRLISDENQNSFLNLEISDISLKINNLDDKIINFYIGPCTIQDTFAFDSWRNFLECDNLITDASIVLSETDIQIDFNVSPFTMNIREETLLRILAFFSKSSSNSSNKNIRKFRINSIDISLSYYPIALKQVISSDILSLSNFKISLSPIYLTDISNFDKLFNEIKEQWIKDLNLSNIFQFVPNIKIINNSIPLEYIIQLLKSYFRYSYNQRKIRYFTKKGKKMINKLAKYGIEYIWQIFD